MKQLIYIFAFLLTTPSAWAQKTGIGTTSPSTRLHVKDTSDPLRLEGLQNGATTTGTTSKTLVVDADGVLKTKSKDNISSVRATGNVTLAVGNTQYFNDATTAPTETIDNLSEFSGHTFTAREDGLYQVSFTVRFASVANVNYFGSVVVTAGNGPTPPQSGTVESTFVAWYGFVIQQTLLKTDIIKLTAGQLMQFKIYSNEAGSTAGYAINIDRID